MKKSLLFLYFVFFLSGAAGLVYEVVWVRLTGLVFGNTAHAIATVLGAFMAGLALGSWRLGRLADRVERPLRTYGILEIAIGVSAALVPIAFNSLHTFYWAIAPSVSAIPAGDMLTRLFTSFIVLLVPTFMMGGTLPMLTRYFTRSVEDVERKVGLLYALNTFGAALGTILAALVLIPDLGNQTTTLIIASLNLAIGLLAIAMDRSAPGAEERFADEPGDGSANVPPHSIESVTPETAKLVLLTLAVSGFVAMTYEVAWTRALAGMLGSSTYAFSIMLVTFLLGIALGSSYVSRRKPPADVRLLGGIQLGVALGGLVFLVGYVVAPYVLVGLVRAFFYSFPALLTIQFIISAMLMIFATLCMGATFPLAGQLYSRRVRLLGRSVGDIYSINTIGSILGSIVSGFLLLSTIGTERTILVGIFLNCSVALLLLAAPSSGKGRPYARWAAAVVLVLTTLSMRGGIFWNPDLLDRGILIYARQFDSRPELKISEHYEDTDVVYFKEGNNASISVRRGEDYFGLRTNGKVDASNKDDMMTQLMMSYLPGFFHPSPKDALVIGYGSGVTVGAATAIPEIRNIDCVEIEPAVVGAGGWFSDFNRKSYENPKVRFTFNDARNFMNVTRKQYDVIISEPSNPWIAGVASLFTAEFYERAAQVLKPDGVFAQWVQLYELDPEDLKMILQEFQRQFPEVSVWNTGVGDLIIIGTRRPQRLNIERVKRIYEGDESVRRDFRDWLKLTRPEGIFAYYVMSTSDVKKFAQTTRRNTDDHPLLEFHAPRELFQDTRDLNVELLYDAKTGLLPPDAEIADLETTYLAMVNPLLAIKRPNLASQSMGLLSQIERRSEATLHLAMAELDFDDGNLAASETELDNAAKAAGIDPAIAGEIEEMKGALSDKNGDPESALSHYLKAAAADPQRAQSVHRVSEIHAGNEDWGNAATWMQRYIDLKPLDPGHAWAMLGDYLLANNKPEPAVQALETALTMDPYEYDARLRLARLFEERNQTDQAIQQYEFIVKYSFDRDADIYLKLANLYKAGGHSADARRILAKGMRMFSTNADIYRVYHEVQGG